MGGGYRASLSSNILVGLHLGARVGGTQWEGMGKIQLLGLLQHSFRELCLGAV